MKFLLPPLALAILGFHAVAAPLKVLLVDGQNNHAWQQTTPELKAILEENGLATVEVATAPAKGADISAFKPDFAAYQVVVSNYNGALWPDATREAFEKYVSGGGGFVSVHAANNFLPRMEGLQRNDRGGWLGRAQ